MRASRKSEGKCAERSEGNLAEGEPEGREAVARGRGSNVKPSRGTSESTRLGIAAPRNTTNAGKARLAPQGQCPNLGGDARRRRKTERGSFSAGLLSRETPRSVLGGFAARVAPGLAGSPLETRSTHLRQTNTP